jgi:hypothetical protein
MNDNGIRTVNSPTSEHLFSRVQLMNKIRLRSQTGVQLSEVKMMDVNVYRAWETIQGNIRISIKKV